MKKKRIFIGILLLILMLTLTGCGIKKEKNERSEGKDNYIFNMGETKSINDKVEMTIKSNKILKRIQPESSSLYYTYYDAGEGYKYLDVIVDVKNISSNSMTMMDIGTSKLKIEGKQYDTVYMAEEDNGQRINGFASVKKIDPLETVTYHIATKVDNSLLEKDSSAVLILKLYGKEYTYTINIVNSQGDNENVSSTIYLDNKGKEIKENELITIENNCEFTIKSNEFKGRIDPPAASGFYYYLNAEDGKIYLNVKITVKNLKNTAVKQDTMLGNITTIYDNSYEYKCSKVVVKENGRDLNTYTSIYNINPLESMEYYILTELPQEVQNSTKPLCVQFSIAGKDYVYKIR